MPAIARLTPSRYEGTGRRRATKRIRSAKARGEGRAAVERKGRRMKLVVTGSIAYDYLMSFPGKFTEHFLPEHMQRVSLSFLVDTMDKRRGGCAPDIALS